jgi:hypothetical protein
MEVEMWCCWREEDGKELWMIPLLAWECWGEEALSKSFSESALGFVQVVAEWLATVIVTGIFFVHAIAVRSEERSGHLASFVCTHISKLRLTRDSDRLG